ncbi:MAG TPA: dethiobiotin synthase [Acidimicrobiales bacterium]|nr:dethiobiotin synthase [Acidimicrobiales bacterium]
MTSPKRPSSLVVVVGTATEIGKTWATCRIAQSARARGVRLAARKPAQSFEATASGAPLEPTDADLLGDATLEAPTDVCPAHRWYPVAMAPPMAAEVLDRAPILLDELVDELWWPGDAEVGVVETAGGVRSPLAHDADSAQLTHRLDPDLVLLVADAALGTINSTRLSTEALRPLRTVVLLNRYDAGNDLHRRNRQWLQERDGLEVVVDPTEVPLR